MKQVAVLIPVYRTDIGKNETIALQSFQRHLGGYDIVYVCPDSLDISGYLKYFPHAMSQRFSDGYFLSLKTYSGLLESEEFYQRFSEYEYILICQLDCLIFRDELKYWCGLGFSYIGSPWNELNFIGEKKRALFHKFSFVNCLFPVVGNGGLSLRKVEDHVRLAKKYRWLVRCFFWLQEDLFWCGLVSKFEQGYRVPDRDCALAFGVEVFPETSVAELGGRLPFGCHAWDKNSPSFWIEKIKDEVI